jgi:hypothetical protein
VLPRDERQLRRFMTVDPIAPPGGNDVQERFKRLSLLIAV